LFKQQVIPTETKSLIKTLTKFSTFIFFMWEKIRRAGRKSTDLIWWPHNQNKFQLRMLKSGHTMY